jgi:hypothetical protein
MDTNPPSFSITQILLNCLPVFAWTAISKRTKRDSGERLSLCLVQKLAISFQASASSHRLSARKLSADS